LQLFHWCLNRKIKTDYLLNDPLERVKTEGMSNPKNMPFLTCPATLADALGGTPLASSADGGQVRKSTWVHVHDAALLALDEPERQADRQEGEQHALGGREGHGSGRLGFGFASLHAEHIPRHVRAQVFAAHPASGRAFDVRALFGRDGPCAGDPLVHCGRSDVQKTSERSL
jgi:hypothetical protein